MIAGKGPSPSYSKPLSWLHTRETIYSHSKNVPSTIRCRPTNSCRGPHVWTSGLDRRIAISLDPIVSQALDLITTCAHIQDPIYRKLGCDRVGDTARHEHVVESRYRPVRVDRGGLRHDAHGQVGGMPRPPVQPAWRTSCRGDVAMQDLGLNVGARQGMTWASSTSLDQDRWNASPSSTTSPEMRSPSFHSPSRMPSAIRSATSF